MVKEKNKPRLMSYSMILAILISIVLGPGTVKVEADPLPGTVSAIYNGNGADLGSVPVDSYTYTYTEGSSVEVLPNTGGLVKEGFQFGGWMTDNIIYQPGDTFIIGDSDVVLTAVWIPVYRIYYSGNGLHSGNPPNEPVEYPSGAHITVKGNSGNLNSPGYYGFKSWNTEPDGSGITYYPGQTLVMGNSDITLYAQYSTDFPLISINYGVSYDANGATSGFVPDGITQYSPITISENTGNLLRKGYAFAGWNTKSDGTGETYKPGDLHNQYGHLKLYAGGCSDNGFRLNLISNMGSKPRRCCYNL